jgi:two-component system, OmpR family, response regulator
MLPDNCAEGFFVAGGKLMRPLKVLVVEDHPDTAEMLAKWSELSGHSTRVCRTGFQALKLAPVFLPDVVLLDIGLPDMNGWDLAESLRQDASLSQTRIIAVTAYQTKDDKQRSQDAGIDYHLAKPAHRNDVVGLLAQVAG